VTHGPVTPGPITPGPVTHGEPAAAVAAPLASLAGTAPFVVAAIALTGVSVAIIARRVRVPENREKLIRELTAALVVAAAGLYVFVAYTVTIAADHGPTRLDDRVLDLAGKLNSSFGVSLAKIVTAFGTLPVTAAFAIAGAVLLAARKRPVELALLVLSVIAIYVSVHITKAATGRPRPPHPLAGSTLSAFPSGHAAYSTIYVALALLTARTRSRRASRAALVIAGLVAAGGIGASRAYLRVHWGSDVLAGWALGAAIFGSAAATGVVVGYFRNNDGGQPAPAAAGAGGTAGKQ
jgi:undecaprenyl-diphosphatase